MYKLIRKRVTSILDAGILDGYPDNAIYYAILC